MSCEHDCARPAVFPRIIWNRPALPKISYRVGTYDDLRSFMFDLLDKRKELTAWTCRGPDDPGIAVLEIAAVVGDILTYYQDLYANEAYLRSADWRESVAELIRLLGYRLAPGVGGEADFALAVKGSVSVTVPKGFGLKAQLKGGDRPVEFESTREIVAHPHLSEFHLYRPPKKMQPGISAGMNQLELEKVGQKTDLASRTALEIKEGDRIMLVPAADMFDGPGVSYSEQKKAELLIVSSVETVLDRVIITFEGSLTEDRSDSVTAYIVDRSFRHFAHNGPVNATYLDDTNKTVKQRPTHYVRGVRLDNDSLSLSAEENGFYSDLAFYKMPLDTEIDDLPAGGKLICQGMVAIKGEDEPVSFVVVRKVNGVRSTSLSWGNTTGPSTVVSLDTGLITNAAVEEPTVDIRHIQFHEVISEELTLRAPREWPDGVFPDGQLKYFGTYKQLQALAGRNLLLADTERGTYQPAKVSSTLADFEAQLTGAAPPQDESDKRMWRVTLAEAPSYKREDFDEADPTITVYGNIVKATQGKTEDEVVLGSGDQRQTFQTFALPKSPLTYLLDTARTPAQAPELQVYVGGLLWKQVDTFFNSGPDDQVYVVREDEEGKSWVQFGDGKTGARLPAGVGNVTAVYRTGVGAAGALKAGSTPQATGKLTDLDKVYMPGPAVGGDVAESEDGARVAAPGKMQSLGRLVSLSDFEAEALALPGVLKARAAWAAPAGIPLVSVTILTESGNDESLGKVRDTLQGYNRCRGPARFPIDVVPGRRQYVYIEIRAGYEASRRPTDVETNIQTAIGLSGEEGNGIEGKKGLFGIKTRQFGRDVHLSQIVGAVQQAIGVTWVQVDAAQLIDQTGLTVTDPTLLPSPPSPVLEKVLACDDTQLLTLHTSHFILTLEIDGSAEECIS